MRRVVGAALALAASAIAPPARAQLVIEASGMASSVQSHLLFASARSVQTGQWVGGEGAIQVGRLRAGLATALGSLGGAADSVNPDRTARQTTLAVHLMAKPWMAVGAVAEARRFDTDVGVTVWRLIGGNLRVTPSLDRALEAFVDVTIWPAATIVGGDKMPFALRTTFGATYLVPGSPLGVRLAYRFERFDFEDKASARLEQFRGATVGLVLRLGRGGDRPGGSAR